MGFQRQTIMIDGHAEETPRRPSSLRLTVAQRPPEPEHRLTETGWMDGHQLTR